QARADHRCVRVQQLTGVGALTADAMVASVGNAREFKNGRQLSAWLGLVPTQHSSGGRAVLGEISCKGDGYLQTLLIQGARISVRRGQAVGPERATPDRLSISDMAGRLTFGKVLVDMANKHARQIWALLARDTDYDTHAWLKHPVVQRPRSKRAPLAACS